MKKHDKNVHELKIKFNLLDKFNDSIELKQIVSETINGIVGTINNHNWSKQIRNNQEQTALQSIIINGEKVEIEELFQTLKDKEFQPSQYHISCTVQLEKKPNNFTHGN